MRNFINILLSVTNFCKGVASKEVASKQVASI